MESCLEITIGRCKHGVPITQPILEWNGDTYRWAFYEISKNMPLLSIDDAQQQFCLRREQLPGPIVKIDQNVALGSSAFTDDFAVAFFAACLGMQNVSQSKSC